MEIDNLTYSDLIDYWHCRNIGSVRIGKKLAREILAQNRSTIIGGNIYYFQIENLGLDVYEIIPLKKSNNITKTFLKK